MWFFLSDIEEDSPVMIRDALKAAQIEAMKAGDKERLAAVRLILAKLKDRDIELRTASQVPEDDAVVVDARPAQERGIAVRVVSMPSTTSSSRARRRRNRHSLRFLACTTNLPARLS